MHYWGSSKNKKNKSNLNYKITNVKLKNINIIKATKELK
jgi:hypothetical protein